MECRLNSFSLLNTSHLTSEEQKISLYISTTNIAVASEIFLHCLMPSVGQHSVSVYSLQSFSVISFSSMSPRVFSTFFVFPYINCLTFFHSSFIYWIQFFGIFILIFDLLLSFLSLKFVHDAWNILFRVLIPDIIRLFNFSHHFVILQVS